MSVLTQDRLSAVVTGTDHAVRQAELKWGIGRLRLVVSDLTRERWDRQWSKYEQAIQENDPAGIEKHALAVRRAVEVLDAEATKAGVPALAPGWFEVRLSDGSVVAVCRDDASASAVAAGRRMSVWTPAEIARLIEGFPTVAKAKEVFPGATVDRITEKAKAFDWSRGDDPMEALGLAG